MSSRNAPSIGADVIDVARAGTYRLLGRLLSAPMSDELLGILNRIDATNFSGGGDPMAAAWQTLKLGAERTTVERASDEFHAVFVGLTRGEVVPYASWYLTGFLMDQPLVILRRDLAALGFERRDGIHEPEDHAGALCETMSLIIDGSAEIAFDTQRNFFIEHLAPWVGKFFRDLQEARSAGFYRAVGQLGEEFIELEKRYLVR